MSSLFWLEQEKKKAKKGKCKPHLLMGWLALPSPMLKPGESSTSFLSL